MYWSPDSDFPYDYPPYDRPRTIERLRHLVFVDGRLVDAWSEPVEGTAYQALADELRDKEQPVRHALPPPPPPRPPYDAVLDWLDSVVGGRVCLLALDEDPLVSEPVLGAPEAESVDGLLVNVAGELFDEQFLAGARAALSAVRRHDPGLLVEAPAVEIAAGICWLVGRANGVVGARTPVSQKVLKRALWLSTSPTRRAPRIKVCLRGLQSPPARRPTDCPELLELGSPTFLTGDTRRRLISLRDRALGAAEGADADRHARGVPGPGGVDSLSP